MSFKAHAESLPPIKSCLGFQARTYVMVSVCRERDSMRQIIVFKSLNKQEVAQIAELEFRSSGACARELERMLLDENALECECPWMN